MRVASLAAGAAGMYCGSCLRDNRLAATLQSMGKEFLLFPLYTPLRTDETNVASDRVLLGGLNVYLQHRFPLARKLPAWVRRRLDSPSLLAFLSLLSTRTAPNMLGGLTVGMLKSHEGPLQREIDELVDHISAARVDVVIVPNLMFAGVGRTIRHRLGVPVVCTLSGEDIFLDDLPSPVRDEAMTLIGQAAAELDGFIALTNYYANHTSSHFGIDRTRIHVSPMGIKVEDFAMANARHDPPRVGFLARVCRPKGLHRLAEAVIELNRTGRSCALHAAGYLGKADRPYLEEVRSLFAGADLAHRFAYRGELTREEKSAFLADLDLFSVPTEYREAKGLFLLEALASGLPAVVPAHGSFPELLASTGGGLLHEPASIADLTAQLRRLLDDPEERRKLGLCGREVVLRDFNDTVMAQRTWQILEEIAGRTD